MWENTIVFAQDAAAQEAVPTGPNMSSSIMFMLIIFAVMWLLIILPNRRRDKQRREMLAALNKGDHVVTSGGMCGTIVGLNDKTVVLKVSEDPVTKIEFVRSAISQVASPDEADASK